MDLILLVAGMVGDDNHVVMYIDGVPMKTFPFYDFRKTYPEIQKAFTADNLHSAAQLSEVRYFAERLTAPEMKAIYEEWIEFRH